MAEIFHKKPPVYPLAKPDAPPKPAPLVPMGANYQKVFEEVRDTTVKGPNSNENGGYTPKGDGSFVKPSPPSGGSSVRDVPNANVVPNSVVLMFVRGWQGGTLHQIAAELGVTTLDIQTASIERMHGLMRLAQSKLRYEMIQRYTPAEPMACK